MLEIPDCSLIFVIIEKVRRRNTVCCFFLFFMTFSSSTESLTTSFTTKYLQNKPNTHLAIKKLNHCCTLENYAKYSFPKTAKLVHFVFFSRQLNERKFKSLLSNVCKTTKNKQLHNKYYCYCSNRISLIKEMKFLKKELIFCNVKKCNV